ncbi:hypothetical protein ACFXCZ_27200 [Streptomyces sp. NPDC059396]|uniref:hypothetical protein n=1 Tax=Streptomyces sp. NPDC059396 TaxID=3346819 RepID=UPI0036760A74
MSSAPEADGERVLRKWLRQKIDGPAADELPVPAPLVQVHVVSDPAGSEPEPDDELEDQPEDDDELEDEEDQEARRPAWAWWSLARRQPAEPVQPHPVEYAPGVHVTINQPEPAAPAPQVDERAQQRLRARQRWLAFHGLAAATGWNLGLGPAMADLLADSGHRAAAVGIGLILVTLIPATYLPGLPHIPPPLRPVVIWLCRIPAATAVLALALNAPGF